uniref:NADH-ubiquinone oxidoreductase chain 3 n=1 Tax=Cecidomyiidae sp. 3 LC-2017 TaxID=2030135 RepID=A0A343LA47_9DIPT|nr:NADH dehydrogenase subunit 3 [Cecidomyiidae sp. 3 LC-2017]
MFMILLIICIFLNLMSAFLSKKLKLLNEKMSSFECGFNPLSFKRLPFSLRFFLIAIIFLIFDIEISLILPSILTVNMVFMFTWYYTCILILMCLIMGLFYEWNFGSLDWL